MLPDSHLWLDRVYTFDAEGKVDDALDVLYDAIDDLFDGGHFAHLDAAIREIDVNRLSSALLVGLLSITLAARDHLVEREGLVRAVERRLQEIYPGNVADLLKGLR